MLHHIQPLGRHRQVVAGVLALSAASALMLLLLGQRTTAKATAPTAPSYSALSNTEPTGLPVATIGSATAQSLGTKGPVFPANLSGPAAANAPMATSIRKLSLDIPNASAWIAKSPEGGICVLASRHHPVVGGAYGLGMSCAAPGADSATLELQPEGREAATIVGVVSDSISAVRLTLSDGTSQTLKPQGNAWALESDAQIESKQEVVGG